MFLIVGLGNPGAKYEKTRHNAGFLILDQLARSASIPFETHKFEGVAGRGRLGREDVILLKPQTFMNLSGRCIGHWLRYFKLPLSKCIVIYDDLDLEPCRVRARLGGSSGGHNGINSMIQELGGDGFHRIKVGIGKPAKDAPNRDTVSWVLGPLSQDELTAYSTQVFDDVMLRLKAIIDATPKNE